MLKVLAVVPSGQVFGLQLMTLRLFERLAGYIDSHFLITRWTDGKFSQRLDELSIPYTSSWLGMFSRKLDRVNLRMTLLCISKLPILYWDFARLIKSYRPDMIYTANYHELILLWPVLSLLHRPVVCHVHNPLPTGRFYRSTFLFWGSAVGHYIGVSQSVASSIANLGVDPDRISVLYNGIDLSRFEYRDKRSSEFTAKYRWPDDAVIVGMTGQMTDAKGHLDLLKAARSVSQKLPQARFVIGGEQEGEYYQSLRKQVCADGLGKILAFSGWQDDMRSFYEGIDVFVLPSRQDTEGLPLVLAEAMAAGLPVVATRSGGAVEIVQNGETGFLVDRQNSEQLAEAISALVTSASKRTSMGKAGRQRVEQFFDLSKQVAQFETILKSVAHSPNG